MMHPDLQQNSDYNTLDITFNAKVNIISLLSRPTIRASKVDLISTIV